MQRNKGNVMLKLLVFVKPLSGVMAVAILTGVLGFLCAIAIAMLGGYAILSVAGWELPFSVSAMIWIFVGAAVFRGVLRYIEQTCNHYIAFKLLAIIRDRIFSVLRKLCPAKLEVKDKGDLISVITSDIELLEVFYAHTISPVAIAILVSAIMIWYLSSIHYLLALIAFAAYISVGLILPSVISKTSGKDGLAIQNEAGKLNSFILESMRGMKESLQYRDTENRLRKLNQSMDHLFDQELSISMHQGRNVGLTGLLIRGFSLFMLLVSLELHRRGSIGFDGVLLSTLAMLSSFGPVTALANLGTGLSKTRGAGNRVLEILEEQPMVEENLDGALIQFEKATADHISFSYDQELIFEDFSCDIRKSEILGIVGESGCGKSTLLKLLMRFWDIDSGKIQISGQDIQSIQTGSLRENESFVTQDTHLFRDSIANNIRLAKPEATEEELVEAAKKASIHDFICSLPKGYETNVGELGSTLSGGEKQRIGLARAFLHDAPLMLLDEPTSNLDSLNEGIVLKALHDSRENRTIVLISHRKSTTGIADRVLEIRRR